MMDTEKRMAGGYEIIQSITLGDREIVLGEDLQAPADERYLCAFCRHTDIALFYEEAVVTEDYLEVMKEFSDRLTAQQIKVEEEMRQPTAEGIDNRPIGTAGCTLITDNDDLRNRIVVIRQDVLRPEYRTATHQIKLCTGGFGAMPHAHGHACFCVDLYSGKEARYERYDILGTMTPEQAPEWARRGLERYRQTKNQEKAKEAR